MVLTFQHSAQNQKPSEVSTGTVQPVKIKGFSVNPP